MSSIRLLLGGLLLVLVVAPLLGWPATGESGVILEFVLPGGDTYRFGPIVLGQGDLVAPGFYKLVLNGSGCVVFNVSPSAGSVAALVRPYKTPDWNAIVSNDEAKSWRLYVSQVSDHYEFMRRDNASNAYVASDGPASDGELVWVMAYTYTDRLEIHASSSGSASWPGNPASPASRVLVGSNMFNGSEVSAQRWIGEIWAVVIHAEPGLDPRSYVVPANGLELLFDPTWYNASSGEFLALGSGGYITGRLKGSAVLEVSEPRLWIVREAYSDQYLHVSLTPYGTKLRILSPAGNVIEEYFIIGDSWGGLVLDYHVPWPPVASTGERSRTDILGYLTIPTVILALLAPAFAWYTGLVGGLTASLVAGVAGLLALRMYGYSDGADRSVWLGLGLLSITLFIVSFMVALLKGLARPRIRPPRLPDLPA